MKMSRKIVGLGLATMFWLTGCGGSDKAASYEMSTASSYAYTEAAPAEAKFEMDYAVEEAVEEEWIADEMEAGSGVSGTSGIEAVKSSTQKLIKTVNIDMETKEFDTLIPAITETVTDLGGYVQTSEVNGNTYNGHNRRYAWLSLRIPAEKLDGFVTIVGEMGNITYKQESVEDITLQYVDVKSHKEALVTEQERLMELLEHAENMEDIIQIETRLSEIRYELQSYESRLRTMDNQVTYSTVTVNISEVERITEVEEKTFFEEISYRLRGNLYDIEDGIRELAIWFISSIPYLVIWAVIIFVAVFAGKRIVRRAKKKGKVCCLFGKKEDEEKHEQ